MYTLGQKQKEVFTFWAIDKFLVYVALTFDYKVILAIRNFCFILHTMTDYCVS